MDTDQTATVSRAGNWRMEVHLSECGRPRQPSSAAGTSAGSGAQDCPHTICRPVLLRPRTGALRLVALLRRAADIAPCPSVTAGRDFPPAPEWCGSDSQPVPEV